MYLAYNTNGLANHGLLDAIGLLAEVGYSGISITLDHCALTPRVALATTTLGARFLLDPLHKHEPTLVSPDPAARTRRIDFLNRAINIAARLNAICVSLWSGVVNDRAGDEAFSRLIESLLARAKV